MVDVLWRAVGWMKLWEGLREEALCFLILGGKTIDKDNILYQLVQRQLIEYIQQSLKRLKKRLILFLFYFGFPLTILDNFCSFLLISVKMSWAYFLASSRFFFTMNSYWSYFFWCYKCVVFCRASERKFSKQNDAFHLEGWAGRKI